MFGPPTLQYIKGKPHLSHNGYTENWNLNLTPNDTLSSLTVDNTFIIHTWFTRKIPRPLDEATGLTIHVPFSLRKQAVKYLQQINNGALT